LEMTNQFFRLRKKNMYLLKSKKFALKQLYANKD
jgi:hypothetical protein